jgi:hypothetical protein
MMASGSVVFSKWAMALSGTALLNAELEVPAEPAPLARPFVDGLALSAFDGGVSVLFVGV